MLESLSLTMHKEKYNINWHTYSDHLKEMLHEMMKSNELADVTLVCDDKKQFKAHKIVLSACSSVFRRIIKDLPKNGSVIYLRGIQHQEMESILEYMYLGIATFYQERINEFLNVAQNLEIKEISEDAKIEDENSSTEDQNKSDTEDDAELDRESQINNDVNERLLRNIRESQLQKNTDGMFECDQCESKFLRKDHLKRHIQSKHEGVRYACNQCDYQASYNCDLRRHIQSKHEGVRYACDQCEYQATQQDSLKMHIQSQHDGVKYACDQCEYQASRQYLRRHIQSKHEGLRYACNQCEYQASYNNDLRKHIQSQHGGMR